MGDPPILHCRPSLLSLAGTTLRFQLQFFGDLRINQDIRGMDQPEPSLIEQLASEDWGTYYLSRYYFSIQTDITRRKAGLTQKKYELTEEAQWALQQANLPAIFHEYFHYIQEISTITGSAVMLNRLTMKSIFTAFLDPDPTKARSLGHLRMPDKGEPFGQAWKTNEALEGSKHLEFNMRKLESISAVTTEAFFPAAPENSQKGSITIPKLTYSGMHKGSPARAEIMLGSFYLYECLAYEMDQIMDRRQRGLTAIADPLKFTEYTVGRMVALYIFPSVRQEIAMAAGLLALQHIDCGNAYIQILQRLRVAAGQGISQDEVIAQVKKEVIAVLTKQRASFFAQQDVYAELFKGRHQLQIAYAHMAGNHKTMYDLRISNPCFELDWFLQGEYNRLIEAVPLCDYLFKFKNRKKPGKDPDFNRDFMATYLPEEITIALKALVAYDHFFLAHRGTMTTELVEAKPKDSHRCPFYTCCHLYDRRKNKELCCTKPWRIYEVQYARDKKYCWYATGVLEAKGHDRRREDEPGGKL